MVSIDNETSLTIFHAKAPAKINLFLHITGKRADGYHLLESLIVFSDFGDELSLKQSEEYGLSIEGEFSAILRQENQKDNLISRAVDAMNEGMMGSESVHVTLQKNIPLQAGIGGGSADAAAVLRTLILMTEEDSIDEVKLRDIAVRLGADIPACLVSSSIFTSGIGEKNEPVSIPLQGMGILLVNPNKNLSTPAVFKRYIPDFSQSVQLPSEQGSRAEWLAFLKNCRNDLECAAIGLIPSIAKVITDIDVLAGCLVARMSGSGATCFGLFDTKDEAMRAEEEMNHLHPEWWVKASFIL